MRDLDWHVRFFAEVLGMTVRQTDGDPADPRQVWTIGGLQLVADPQLTPSQGRLAHLGLMVTDRDTVLAEAVRRGAVPTAQGPNWLLLPEGLCLEILQAHPGEVDAALAVRPRT